MTAPSHGDFLDVLNCKLQSNICWPLRWFIMRTLIATFLVSMSMLPSLALAKRVPVPKVDPIVHGGIRYVVPNDKGTRAYIEAWDTSTGKRLWTKTVFTTWINPFVEHCIQWVFIQDMRLDDGRLVISSERGKTYSLDLKTKRVRKLKRKHDNAA